MAIKFIHSSFLAFYPVKSESLCSRNATKGYERAQNSIQRSSSEEVLKNVISLCTVWVGRFCSETGGNLSRVLWLGKHRS